MEACPNNESILSFVDETSDERERTELARHVGDCESCAALIAQLVRDRPVTSTLPTEDASGPPPVRMGRPSRISRYRVTDRIGAGGMGEVWRAIDDLLDREVAIKVMRHSASSSADAAARFLREARIQGRLEHPSIVPVHDVGDAEAEPFFVMKRLTGTTLADVLTAQARGEMLDQWPRRKLLARFIDVCLAIELAHQHGVIHRDLKPANIVLGNFGESYVLDWGLARISTVHETAPAQVTDEPVRNGETAAGTILGTPGFMAPEQMRGEAIDHRADVFALGCILFEILTGAPAIPRGKRGIIAEYYRPSKAHPDADVAPELDAACARATARDPSARHASARALADAVQAFLDGDRDLERRKELAATHAARAVAALAGDRGTDGRVEAMREAGRAIALDPTHRDAQDVLARLLLEPPPTIPGEAQRRIEEERQANGRAMLRTAARGYLVFGLLMPLVKLIGARGTWPYVLTAALLVMLSLVCSIVSRLKIPLGTGVLATVVALHCSTQVVLGILLGPLLILPMLSVGSLAIMLVMPAMYAPKRIFAFHIYGIVTPIALEWLGVVPATFRIDGGALVLKPWAIDLGPVALLVGVLGTLAVQMGAVAVIVSMHRRAQDYAQERLHVQRWQLAQLVPAESSPRSTFS